MVVFYLLWCSVAVGGVESLPVVEHFDDVHARQRCRALSPHRSRSDLPRDAQALSLRPRTRATLNGEAPYVISRVLEGGTVDRLWTALAAYATLAALITITPGVDNVLVLRFATVGGWRPALSAGLGISLGCLVWAASSVLGLTAVLAASELAFTLVRVAGAVYLCWLGIVALWHTRLPASAQAGAAPTDLDGSGSSRRAFRAGLMTNLFNPKAGVFFLAVLPQFLPAGYPTLPTAALFVAVHLSGGMLWFALIAAVVEHARPMLSKPAVRRRLEQAAGLVFIALALRLAIGGR